MGDQQVNRIAELPPRGHYLAYEVGALSGVSGVTIGSWARYGLIDSSQGTGRPRVYSFQDIASAMVVHELLIRGASRSDIRWIVSDRKRATGIRWPLLRFELFTYPAARTGPADAKAEVIFKDAGTYYGRYGVDGDQLAARALDPIHLERVTDLLRAGGWVARSLGVKSIEVDPDRLSGRPTIRGQRLSVEKVAQLATSAGGRTTLREDYGLTPVEIKDARKWWEAVQALRAA
jgi:uncharacterized protein (DUF433 family)/DNA-binding transcriptional MerR regulator